MAVPASAAPPIGLARRATTLAADFGDRTSGLLAKKKLCEGGGQMRSIICSALMALTIMMVGAAPVRAAAPITGNDIYPGCVLLVHPPASPPPAGDILVQGYCAGAVSAVALTSPYVCPPSGWITGQAVAVVLRFLDMHPERRNESFFALALEALGRAWPCKKPQQPRP